MTEFLLQLQCRHMELALRAGVSPGPHRQPLRFLTSAEQTRPAAYHVSLNYSAQITEDSVKRDLTDLDGVTEDDTNTSCLLRGPLLDASANIWSVKQAGWGTDFVLAGPACAGRKVGWTRVPVMPQTAAFWAPSACLLVVCSNEDVAAQISEQEGRQAQAPRGSGVHTVCAVCWETAPGLTQQTGRNYALHISRSYLFPHVQWLKRGRKEQWSIMVWEKRFLLTGKALEMRGVFCVCLTKIHQKPMQVGSQVISGALMNNSHYNSHLEAEMLGNFASRFKSCCYRELENHSPPAHQLGAQNAAGEFVFTALIAFRLWGGEGKRSWISKDTSRQPSSLKIQSQADVGRVNTLNL